MLVFLGTFSFISPSEFQLVIRPLFSSFSIYLYYNLLVRISRIIYEVFNCSLQTRIINTRTLSCIHVLSVNSISLTWFVMRSWCVFFVVAVACPILVPGVDAVMAIFEDREYKYLEWVTFSCLEGYQYSSGSENRSCLANATWSGEPYTCTRMC